MLATPTCRSKGQRQSAETFAPKGHRRYPRHCKAAHAPTQSEFYAPRQGATDDYLRRQCDMPASSSEAAVKGGPVQSFVAFEFHLLAN